MSGIGKRPRRGREGARPRGRETPIAERCASVGADMNSVSSTAEDESSLPPSGSLVLVPEQEFEQKTVVRSLTIGRASRAGNLSTVLCSSLGEKPVTPAMQDARPHRAGRQGSDEEGLQRSSTQSADPLDSSVVTSQARDVDPIDRDSMVSSIAQAATGWWPRSAAGKMSVFGGKPPAAADHRFAVEDYNGGTGMSRQKAFSRSFSLGLTGRAAFNAFVEGPIFESISILVILASAVLLGAETNYMASNGGISHPFFEGSNVGLNVLFLVELLLRLYAARCSFFNNQNWRWNWADLILVSCSTADLGIVVAELDVELLSVGRLLRGLRLVRLTRLIRLLRTLRSVREFHKMVYAVLSSLRTLCCAQLILTFVIYFFAVLFCQGVIDVKLSKPDLPHEKLDERYGSVLKSFFTLFASASTGIDWSEAFIPLGDLHEVYSLGFLVYITLILFGVANVVTSVFVESAIMSAQHYRDLIVDDKEHARSIAVVHMKEIFRQIDQDESGEISADEMEYFLTEPNLKSYVDALDISPENTRMLFRLMDVTDSGKIDVEEFCDGCLRLQGDAKSVDVHTMIYQVRMFLAKWSEFTSYVEHRFSLLEVSTAVHGAERLPVRVSMQASMPISEEVPLAKIPTT